MKLDDPQDRGAAAAEYVMGTLDPDECADFEALLSHDRALQAEVYAWQDKLLSLALRVAPAEPPATHWAGIEARLALPTATATVTALDRDGAAANDPLARRLRRWQAISGFALAACLVLGTMLLVRGLAPAGGAPERYLTLLQAPDKSTGWVVEVTAGQRLRLVPMGPAGVVPPGKALQFWTKLDGAAGPTSLGLVRPGEVTELPLDRLPGVAAQQLFELTLEPETGSPIGRPTGPILFVGRSVRI